MTVVPPPPVVVPAPTQTVTRTQTEQKLYFGYPWWVLALVIGIALTAAAVYAGKASQFVYDYIGGVFATVGTFMLTNDISGILSEDGQVRVVALGGSYILVALVFFALGIAFMRNQASKETVTTQTTVPPVP